MLENPAWLFALATIIACLGIITVFSNMMNRLAEIINEDDEANLLQREMTRFFIKIVIIEIIPIVLLIVGITKINQFNGTLNDMIVPLIVTVIIFLFSLVVIFFTARRVQNTPDISSFLKNQVSTFMMMGIAISSTFPLIAFIMIYLAG